MRTGCARQHATATQHGAAKRRVATPRWLRTASAERLRSKRSKSLRTVAAAAKPSRFLARSPHRLAAATAPPPRTSRASDLAPDFQVSTQRPERPVVSSGRRRHTTMPTWRGLQQGRPCCHNLSALRPCESGNVLLPCVSPRQCALLPCLAGQGATSWHRALRCPGARTRGCQAPGTSGSADSRGAKRTCGRLNGSQSAG